MKTFVLFIAATFALVTVKAQFTENFDATTISNLTSNCWILSGVTTTTQNGEAISANSIYTLPPVNPGTKVDIYTPILNFTSASTTITFDYRLTQSLNGNATRSIQVGLVNLFGVVVTSNTITMGAGTTTDVKQFQHTFSSVVPGNYRVFLRIMGAYGNGSVRLVLDNFQVSGATLSISSGGCILVPIIETILPVKLVSFTATLNSNKVDLKWITATEINVSHFTVERSTDGTNFNDAGMVFAYGNTSTNSNYVLSDNISNMQSSIIYYRLRSVDIDGKSEYSDTRIIRINKQTENKVTLVTYPNPVTNELRITIPANWQNKKVVYEVFNANGQTARKIEATASSQTETVNVSNLNSGLYIVKVTCEGQTAQQKIVKQ